MKYPSWNWHGFLDRSQLSCTGSTRSIDLALIDSDIHLPPTAETCSCRRWTSGRDTELRIHCQTLQAAFLCEASRCLGMHGWPPWKEPSSHGHTGPDLSFCSWKESDCLDLRNYLNSFKTSWYTNLFVHCFLDGPFYPEQMTRHACPLWNNSDTGGSRTFGILLADFLFS